MNDWLRESHEHAGDALFDVHPSSEELVRWHDAPDDLDAARRESIAVHLRWCASCEDDVARLRALSAHAPTKSTVAAVRRRRGIVWIPLAMAAAAASVFLGTQWPQNGNPRAIVAIGPPTVLLPDVERGALVRIDASTPTTLTFVLAPGPEGPPARCAIDVIDASGAVTLELEAVEAWDRFGTFVMMLPAHLLKAGPYTLRATDTTGSVEFGFEVVEE